MFDADELPPLPALAPETYDRLQQALQARGAVAAVEQLCDELQSVGDLNALFYALLMKARVELGVTPFPMGAAADLPKATHETYENAIRAAGRHIGAEFLKKHDLRQAWFYFNMLGEPEPVRQYLADLTPTDADDLQPIIEIALYQGVLPEKGFQLVVERYGICNAITTYSGQDFSRFPAAKQRAIAMLVKSLYEQLRERLVNDVEAQGGKVSPNANVGEIVAAHPELFAEGGYHVDTSHLSSIAQFSLELDACPERELARQLCAYGEKLGTSFQYDADPPFEHTYADYKILLAILEGENVEAGLQHFAAKIEPAMGNDNTFPAEVYVNILLKLDRKVEALAVAKKYLAGEKRQLSCPSVYELCQQAGDYAGLAEAAKSRADGVNYLASLIAAQTK